MASGKGTQRFTPVERSLLVGSVVLITLFAFESLATTTVMPTVLSELGGVAWLPLASGAALAMQVVSSAAAGPLTNWQGPRVVLVVGLSLFAGGLLVAAFSPSIGFFVTGRALQGLGAGAATVPLYVLVGSLVAEPNRPKFFAAFSMAWVLPSLIGPPIAGFIVEWFGWRPIFWFVPILIAGASLVLSPLLAHLQVEKEEVDVKLARHATLALVVGASLLAAQFSSSIEGFWALGLLAISLSTALLGLSHLLPKGTFTFQVGIPALVATRGLTIAAHVSATSLVPMVLQDVHDWSPAAASLAVGLGSLSWAAGSILQARVTANRVRLVETGAAAIALGLAVLLVLPGEWAFWPVGILGAVIAGLGIGLAHATLSDLALARLPKCEHANISAALQISDTAGPALALALVSVALVLTSIVGAAPWTAAFAVSLLVALLSVFSARRIG